MSANLRPEYAVMKRGQETKPARRICRCGNEMVAPDRLRSIWMNGVVAAFAARLIRRILPFACVLGCLFSSGAAAEDILRIGGTGSGSVLLRHLAEDYRHTKPDLRIEVMMPPLGSAGALRALAGDKIDLAILGRKPKPEEGKGLASVLWSETPLVLATSNGRKTGGFDIPAFERILRDRRGQWDDGAPIRLILRMPTESDNRILAKHYPKIGEVMAAALRDPVQIVADTDLDALDLIATTPGSLGTTTLGLITLTQSRVTIVPLDGALPAAAFDRPGRYPLMKPLYLAYRGEPGRQLSEFLRWLNSPAVAARLRKSFHLPATP